MSTMKKYYYILALVTTFLVACDNEDNLSVNDTTPEGAQRLTYIRADANEDATTRGSVDGTTAAFTWNTGDKVAVYTTDGYKISNGLENTYDGTNAATFAFSDMTDAHRANFAVYPASLVWDGTDVRSGSATDYTSSSLKLTLPASYTLAEVQNDVSPTPMIATNTTEGKLSFKTLCPLIRVTVNFIPKQTKRLEFDFNGKKVQGEFTLTSVEAGTTAIATSATTGTDDIITVTMADNTAWHDNLVVNLPVPTGTYDNMTVTAYDAVTAGNALLKITKPIKSGGWTPTRKASRKMTASLPVFSVSSSKKVIFSPGNLQATYNGSSWSWGFAEHQWDYIGNAPGNTSINGNGSVSASNVTVDLFGWVGSSSSFSGDIVKYGITNSTTLSNYGKSNEALKSDWGNTVNAGWRTMSSSEWAYIFYRTTTSGLRYAKATVNDVSGVILLPDDWSSSYYTLESSNTSDAAYTVNEINSTDWTNDFESHGAVFLPAGGYRDGTNVYFAGSIGYYWSTSSNSSYSTDVESVRFASNALNYHASLYRSWGASVRLVRDAK